MSTLELARQLFAKQTQEDIKAAVDDLRAENPNMSFADAFNQVAREKPNLFPKVEAEVPVQRSVSPDGGRQNPAGQPDHQKEIIDEANKLMKLNPGMLFSTATSPSDDAARLVPWFHGARDGERRKGSGDAGRDPRRGRQDRGPLTKRKLKHCKGSVILVNDQRSAALSDKPNARKRKGSQHPDLR
jgi:hypothetical protein